MLAGGYHADKVMLTATVGAKVWRGRAAEVPELARGWVSGAAPSAAPQHHYRVGSKGTANLE